MEGRPFGAFTLHERLGTGGMGTVYRATHNETGREVAIKILSTRVAQSRRAIQRFAQEIEILKALKHPNIVRCYGGGRHETEAFMVMELVTGGSLASLLRRRGRLPWETAVEYLEQICAGLQHAHEWGVIHRDLTPRNLLLDSRGQIKIADFGIARVGYGRKLTATKHTLGTLAYMAPEQIRGKPPISPRTDLYTLGCVLFELLTGELPFQAESTAQIMYQHLSEDPPRVSSRVLDCPFWLEALVGQLLEKDPERRPHDAGTVLVALQEVKAKVAAGEGVAEHAAGGGPSALRVERDREGARRALGHKPRKRRREQGPFYERAWFLALALLITLGVATWAFWPAGEEELFRKGEALMAMDRRPHWSQAREYFEELLERFPEGKYAAAAREQIDRIDMADAEARLMMKLRQGRELTNEGERLFAEAYRFEQFGDRVTALERYDSLIKLLGDRREYRPYVNLARRQLHAIKEGETPPDRLALIQERLQQADALAARGELLEAKKIWHSIQALYSGNKELEPLVAQAEERLAGKRRRASSATDESPAPADGPPAEPHVKEGGDEAGSPALLNQRIDE